MLHLLCSVEVLLESPGSLAGHDPVLLQLLQNRVHLTLSQSAHNRREGRILALLGISSLCSHTSPLPLTVPCSPGVLEQSGPVPVPLPTAPEPSSLSSCVLKPQSPAYDGSPERRQSVANNPPDLLHVDQGSIQEMGDNSENQVARNASQNSNIFLQNVNQSCAFFSYHSNTPLPSSRDKIMTVCANSCGGGLGTRLLPPPPPHTHHVYTSSWLW